MEIMFEDLTPQAQERLLEEAGVSKPEDMHWDKVPIAVAEFSKNGHELEEDDFAEDIYDYGEDDL